jgi:hypothetical protein
MNTSPPIPPWASSVSASCKGLAQGYSACRDSRSSTGAVGNDVVLSHACSNCVVHVSTSTNYCWASRTVGAETEVFDIDPNVNINGSLVTVKGSATKGQGSCEVWVNYSITDGSYTKSLMEITIFGWTVN